MKLLNLLFVVLPLLAAAYVFWHIWQLIPFSSVVKTSVLVILGLAFALLFVTFSESIDRLPLTVASAIYEISTSWLIILFYLFFVFLLLDMGRLLHVVPSSWVINSMKGTLSISLFLVVFFTYGYCNYLHKVRVPINISTDKLLERPLKLVMITDLHLGYHNRKTEIERWMKMINAEEPDLVLIGGDVIDRSMRPLIECNMAETLRQLKAPVYACLGNHEYYAGQEQAQKFYYDAGINLLRDSAVVVNGINIIGRDDRTNPKRQSVQQLVQHVNLSRFTILLDHQPFHLEHAAQAGIDFQLSGHTHYGQVWPASWLEEMIYEKAYGHLKKGNTQYFVSSGLGIWGGKFRVGTQSEYLVVHISHGR